jgi:hypothetical protein
MAGKVLSLFPSSRVMLRFSCAIVKQRFLLAGFDYAVELALLLAALVGDKGKTPKENFSIADGRRQSMIM